MINIMHDLKPKGFAVHTLVAKQFIENNNPERNQVNHKDGVKTNNNVDNLELVTALENTRHAIEVLGYNKIGKNNPRAKKVIGFDKKTHKVKYAFDSVADAGRYFQDECDLNNNPRKAIYRAMHGYRKTYHGCTWELSQMVTYVDKDRDKNR